MDHYEEMKEEMAKISKLDDIKHEDFRSVQSYMKSCSIESARMKFSLRGRMYNCRANYHGSYDTNNRGCPACMEARGTEDDSDSSQDGPEVEEETQSHLGICPHYSHLRQGLDIATTEGMVQYFQAVLRERDKK